MIVLGGRPNVPDAREEAMRWLLPTTTMADTADKIFIGKGEEAAWLTLALANRHGLVTGATGTGKTVTLQVMAEGFARAGVPVFAADIKGDLSGIAETGEAKDFILKRATEMGLKFEPDRFSAMFWDVFGEQGHPVRATVTEMGPLLLSRMLDLNDVQEGVLNVAFRVADENGLTLVDMKDLRALLDAIVPRGGKKGPDAEADPLDEIRKAAQSYGNVSKATVGTIQRQLLVLENQGGTKFFGEPALTLKDFMKTDSDGRGMVNILVADKLMESPRLYATFLLWMLSELFEELPEAGDLPKPKLVFFFDEAHLLFNDAPKALMDKIEQVVRLIRSKGVGVYFVTQNPIDVPDKVLAQLGNRVQHALRAFTPRDQKAVAAAAQTFRPNPKLDTTRVIMELGKGEALVSFLEGGGTPIDGRARDDQAAIGADRTDHAGGAQGDHEQEPGEGQIRHDGRCGIRVRDDPEAHRRHGGDRGGSQCRRRCRGRAAAASSASSAPSSARSSAPTQQARPADDADR